MQMKEVIIQKVEQALNKIRPFLQKDGGDVQVNAVDQNGVLELEFVGNCSTCSMSKMTFKNGIAETIKQDVPEITAINVINLTEELI